MNEKNRNDHGERHGPRGHRHGPSSYWMHDPALVFGRLELKDGGCFLDMGCGPGDYTVGASRIVGDSGTVYALDASQTMINGLRKKVSRLGIKNVNIMVCDITCPLPIKDGSADVCLMATVLHIPAVAMKAEMVFTEVHRILRPGGHFGIIECKKEDSPFGPPREMRLSPEDVSDLAWMYGFERMHLTDLGYNYLIQFAVD